MAANTNTKADEAKQKATAAFVEVALDEAYAIAEEYTALVERRKENRTQLRSLIGQGFLSDEQKGEVDELYPPRPVKTKDGEPGSDAEPESTPEPAKA